MSQGYGPQDGQQWGPQDPNQQPQWGQPDQGQQWGQPSPAPSSDPWGQQSAQPAFGATAGAGYAGASPAPGGSGYPGAVGASPQFMPGDGVNWLRVRTLGMSLLIGVALLLLIRLGASLASFLMADSLASGGEELGAMAIGGSLATLLLWVANVIVSLAVLVVAIVAAVVGRGRARIGGIVVAAAIPVAVITSWIIGFIVGVIFGVAAPGDPGVAGMTANGYRINAGVDALRVLVMIAIMAVGAWLVFDTAKKKLAA